MSMHSMSWQLAVKCINGGMGNLMVNKNLLLMLEILNILNIYLNVQISIQNSMFSSISIKMVD